MILLVSFKRYFLAMLFLFIITSSYYASSQGNESKQEDSVSKSDSTQLYMLTYDHGGLVLWGTEHFAKYLRNEISWLDRYPGFKIGLDNEAYTYDYLEKHDTVLLNEMRGYLKKYKGRLGIGTCTYGQPLSTFINEESNIRQIEYALGTDKAVFNYTPSVYLMSEHAMHSQIPQILNGFGFKGAIMRSHFMMYGYNPCFNSAIGWWTGIDGSRIPAIPTYEGEGSGFGWVTEDNLILTRYPGPECSEPLEDFQKKFSKIHPLLATRADDSGLRQEGLVKEYEGINGYKWVLLDDVFNNFPSPEDIFKTFPNDFHVRMPWGYCGNEIWSMSRQAETKVLTAERLAAFVSLLGGENYETSLKEAWKNLLVGQHHDIQICGILKDSRRFLPASISLSDSIIRCSMNYVSSEMQGGKLAQITVFNPLSWKRNDWISVNVTLPQTIKNISVQMGNNPVPFEILSSTPVAGKGKNMVQVLLQVQIPELTFQSISIVQAKSIQQSVKAINFDRQKLQITTPFWILTLNKKGGISALTSRVSGKEMLRGDRSCYFAGVINGAKYESVGKWEIDSTMIGNNNLIMHEDGYIGEIPYQLKMTINAGTPGIDFAVKFHFNEEKIGR
jgi:alpha-mannosidase